MSVLPYFLAAALLFAVAATGPALHLDPKERQAELRPALPSRAPPPGASPAR